MIPLFSLIVGVVIGFRLAIYFGYESQQELIGTGVGFVFLAASYLFLRLKDNKLKENKSIEIVISHIIK